MADPGSSSGLPTHSTAPPAPVPRERLDRSALERVLARAAQLQSLDSDTGDAMLTEEQIIEVGREVGISPPHLRQALAEERSRSLVPDEGGGMARLFGSARVHASRTVRSTPESAFALLDSWLQREESLQVKRRFADRMLWEPRAGFLTDIKRGLNLGGYGYHLSRAEEVAATVVPVDRDRVLVRLEADLANVRLQRVASGGAIIGTGALGTGTLLALGFFAPVAAIPAGLAILGGYLVARSHAPLVARAQITLEQLLDRLERGDGPGVPLSNILGLGGRR